MPLSSPAEGGAPYGFIFVTTDPTLTGGGRGSAWELARHRLANGRWPLYERTPNRKRIDVGSRVACYIAGTGVNAGSIVATAIVGAVQKVGRRPVRIDPECCLTDPPHTLKHSPSHFFVD